MSKIKKTKTFLKHQKVSVRSKTIQTVRNALSYGLLNARSINNKTDCVIDFILEHKLDILCITENWLHSDDIFTTNHVTPIGYSIVSSPRLNRRGGGIAVIIKDNLHFKRLACASFSTFEVLLLQITSSSKSFLIGTVYRPPGPLSNFLTEFSELTSTLLANYKDFILAGDFNIHVDIATDDSSKKLTEQLKNFNLVQHVKLPTHIGGHTLDLSFQGLILNL
jgi:exonuclease III